MQGGDSDCECRRLDNDKGSLDRTDHADRAEAMRAAVAHALLRFSARSISITDPIDSRDAAAARTATEGDAACMTKFLQSYSKGFLSSTVTTEHGVKHSAARTGNNENATGALVTNR